MQKRIGLFFKTATPGAVKTRLSPPLSAGDAALLYGAFLEDAVVHCRRVAGATLVLFHAGEPRDPIPAALEGLPIQKQEGFDLGARMHAAFRDLLEPGVEGAALVGSDSPTLPPRLIEEALRRLAHDDLVLGPAADGGYYLVALKRPEAALFSGIEWSGPRVFEKTLHNAARAGLKASQLESWYDVDTPEDLARLVEDLAGPESSGRAPATRKMLNRLGLLRG